MRAVPAIAAIVFTTALTAVLLLAAPAPAASQSPRPRTQTTLPRTADGKPNFDGIWQVQNSAAADLLDHPARLAMPAGRGVVAGGDIPYQPWAAARKKENFAARYMADPLAQ